MEHVGGDMFISVPKGDAIFLKVAYVYTILTFLLVMLIYPSVHLLNYDSDLCSGYVIIGTMISV